MGVFSSLIRCSVAMLATNPMPGSPSISMGLLSSGFSVKYTVHVIAFHVSFDEDGFNAGN